MHCRDRNILQKASPQSKAAFLIKSETKNEKRAL